MIENMVIYCPEGALSIAGSPELSRERVDQVANGLAQQRNLFLILCT